jgi:hypothetical protein
MPQYIGTMKKRQQKIKVITQVFLPPMHKDIGFRG